MYFSWQSVVMGGGNLASIYQTLAHPEQLKADPKFLETLFSKLYQFRKDSGAVFPPDLNIQDARQAILTSDCPLQQYHIEIARLLGLDVEIFKNLGLSMHVCNGILIPGVVEEFVFRQVIQDWILKKGVRKAVECISPQHASFVDHKAYTACRILLSSLAFSAIHATNGVMFPDEYVSVQIRATFVMGIAFGILKEMVGLPAAMGAHMVQNTVALLPGMMTTC